MYLDNGDVSCFLKIAIAIFLSATFVSQS